MRPAAKGKAVVVHSLAQARAALAAASALRVPVVLLSGPNAAAYAGAAWFAEVARRAQAAYPKAEAVAILDCGEAPGYALQALRLGLRAIRLGGHAQARRAVAAIAKKMGAALDTCRRETFDLAGANDPEKAARDFLAPKRKPRKRRRSKR